MRVLVACEFSGVVREAFAKRGHDAWSCDLLPTEIPGTHIQCDLEDPIFSPVFGVEAFAGPWDLLIAFPPCTHLASSGARWFKEKQYEQALAVSFVCRLMQANVPKIAIENPVGVLSTRIRKPDQIIQPWQFGHEASKTTCLWLKNLPKLEPTNVVGRGEFHTTKSGRRLPKWYNLPPSENRARERSRTFQGIADAMAEQWG